MNNFLTNKDVNYLSELGWTLDDIHNKYEKKIFITNKITKEKGFILVSESSYNRNEIIIDYKMTKNSSSTLGNSRHMFRPIYKDDCDIDTKANFIKYINLDFGFILNTKNANKYMQNSSSFPKTRAIVASSGNKITKGEKRKIQKENEQFRFSEFMYRYPVTSPEMYAFFYLYKERSVEFEKNNCGIFS